MIKVLLSQYKTVKFCQKFPNFRYRGNKRQTGVNFSDNIRLSDHYFLKKGGIFWQSEVLLWDFERVYYVAHCNTGSRSHAKSTTYFQFSRKSTPLCMDKQIKTTKVDMSIDANRCSCINGGCYSGAVQFQRRHFTLPWRQELRTSFMWKFIQFCIVSSLVHCFYCYTAQNILL